MRRWGAPFVLVLIGLLGSGRARADSVTDANALLLEVIRTTRPAAPRAARLIAMMNVAVFDSANAAAGLPFQPYSYDGMAVRQADPATAAAAAAVGVVLGFFPDLKTSAPDLAARIAALVPSPGNTAAVDLGRACADAVLAARAGDGADKADGSFPGMTRMGVWRPTPPARSPAVLPNWGKVRPFAIPSATTFAPPPPPAVGSMDWIDSFNAVKSVGSTTGASHTDDLGEIARFWADDDGTETPPGHWIAIALDIVAQRQLGVVENARLFALLGTALADSAVTTWAAKYRYASWRPVTAIRDANQNPNPRIVGDPDWTPVLTTPAFPEYPSGHSTFSAAAAVILATVLGTDAIAIDATSRGAGMAGIKHHFDRLSDAAEEAGLSRIYAGIHFYFSHVAGAESGRKIAESILSTRMLPAR